MSNRGFRVTAQFDGTRSCIGHDDRWQSSNQRYRGKKPWRGKNNNYNRGGGRNRNNQSGPNPLSRLDNDGDVGMLDTEPNTSNRRYNPYGRSSHQRSDNRQDGRSSDHSRGKAARLGLPIDFSTASADRWFKITIPYGKKVEKSFVLKMLTSMSKVPFKPVHYHFEGNQVVFFVQDQRVSDAIKQCHRQITMPNGFKMLIIVRPTSPPIVPLDNDAVEKLKVCLSDRYDPSSKTLNLGEFHQDEGLKKEHLYLSVTRDEVMTNIGSIIAENIPELECLNVSRNKMYSLSLLSKLVSKAPNITSLDLRGNKLRHISDLEAIKGWKLDDIVLDGNDLCDKFQEKSVYISAIRTRFPKIKRLDGHDLPPPIMFDIEANISLPSTKESFFLNSEVQEIVVKFLKEYFTIYDSDNRHNLMNAYHNDAVFTISTTYNVIMPYKQASLKDYYSHCRNLTKHMETERRLKLMKKGSGAIVSGLFLLPKSIHDPNSFVIDVGHASAALLVFTVSGLFKEGDSKADKPPIRAFSRQFVTLPAGTGMVISNDMLHVTNASTDQAQKVFKQLAPTPSSSPVPQTSQAPFPQPGPSFTVEQQAMIVKFSEQSKMNTEWSVKCLEQNFWDYEKAGQVFLELQSQQKIPAEAFVK